MISGAFKTDFLISNAVALLLSLLLTVPIFLCVKINKNPLEIRGLNVLYMIYYIVMVAINANYFSEISSNHLNPEFPNWVFGLLILIVSVYAAYLGIEGIGRFSSFSFIISVITLVAVVALSVRSFETVNLSPIIYNSTEDIILNTVILTSNTAESAILLALAGRINGKKIMPYITSVFLSHGLVLILFLFVIGVLGAGAALFFCPSYTLSQLAKIGLFERLDIVYNIFWILCFFIKISVLIFCASTCVKKLTHGTKCIGVGVVSCGLFFLIQQFSLEASISKWCLVISFLLFTAVLPLLTLLFKKGNEGDELLEKF